MAEVSEPRDEGTHPSVSTEVGKEHSHGHDGNTAHHFVNYEQQKDAGTLGMWVFLATEVMFIGAIFVAYFSYRLNPHYFASFKAGSENLITWIGAVNTAVLLTSSLTVVLGIRAIQMNKKGQLVLHLILTMILGSAFFGFKVLEYYKDYQEHLWPSWTNYTEAPEESGTPVFHPEKGEYFAADNPDVQDRLNHGKLFYRFYYTLTGLHAAHMLVGLGIFLYLTIQAIRGKYTPQSHAQVEISGLYWHFVDLVWIFLFPLLYLIR